MIEFKNQWKRINVDYDGVPICDLRIKLGAWVVYEIFDAFIALTAADLRQIADKLDELNGVSDE